MQAVQAPQQAAARCRRRRVAAGLHLVASTRGRDMRLAQSLSCLRARHHAVQLRGFLNLLTTDYLQRPRQRIGHENFQGPWLVLKLCETIQADA